ncbi:endonuclease VIII-like 3 [Spatholobus suberectus]|nr:endonuclease VIII-like 3 [Spatholobus suberectus]
MSLSSSPSPSPSPSRVQRQQSTPEIPANCSPKLVKRMQQDTCYTCKQRGHWSWYCPSKSPKTKPISPSPKQDSPVSHNTIQCRCGHGSCEIKTSRRGSDYYACPIKRGAKCNEFVKWCDDPIDERDLQPPPFKYPECECGAGVCRRVKGTERHDAFKYYFACPVKQAHGSCGYRASEDELLNSNSNSKSIVPVQQSRQRTLQEFWEGCQNDEIDNELGNELGKGDGLHVQIKRMRIRDCSENSLSIAGSEIPDIDAGAALNAANLKRDIFPELEDADNNIEFTNSVSWETIEAEAFQFFSRLSSTSSRISWRQTIFQRRIFADASFGSCPLGWLGRLLFFYPAQSLKFPTPKPFFCCVFPSYNPIVVPKQTSIPDGPYECNQVAISSASQHTQLSTGCHTEVSGDVVSPSKSQDGERKSIMSKAQRHREVALFTQQRLLTDLETLDPHEHESMREAAETTFTLLNILGVDYKQFSDHVFDYINFVTSIAEIDKSMENSLTLEEHNKLFEEEKMRFAQLQDDYVKTEALLEASNRQRQLLCEQVSNLKAMLNEKQKQLKFCELENSKIETNLGDLKRKILETDITLKERAEQTEVARKQSEERQTKQIAAKEALEKAKLELEN